MLPQRFEGETTKNISGPKMFGLMSKLFKQYASRNNKCGPNQVFEKKTAT